MKESAKSSCLHHVMFSILFSTRILSSLIFQKILNCVAFQDGFLVLAGLEPEPVLKFLKKKKNLIVNNKQ